MTFPGSHSWLIEDLEQSHISQTRPNSVYKTFIYFQKYAYPEKLHLFLEQLGMKREHDGGVNSSEPQTGPRVLPPHCSSPPSPLRALFSDRTPPLSPLKDFTLICVPIKRGTAGGSMPQPAWPLQTRSLLCKAILVYACLTMSPGHSSGVQI